MNKQKAVQNKKHIFAYVDPELHAKTKEYCAKHKVTIVFLISELLANKVYCRSLK